MFYKPENGNPRGGLKGADMEKGKGSVCPLPLSAFIIALLSSRTKSDSGFRIKDLVLRCKRQGQQHGENIRFRCHTKK